MKLLDVAAVSDRLGLTKARVRSLCARGLIASLDLGTHGRREFFVSEAAIERFLAGEAPKPQPPKQKIQRRGRIDAHVPKVF